MKLLIIGGDDGARAAVVERLIAATHDTAAMSAGEAAGPAAVRDALLAADGVVLLDGLEPSIVRSVVAAAGRGGVRSIVLVVRRRAASARAAEEAVRTFTGVRRILRVPHVYSPGDPLFGALVTMIRSLPMIPVPQSGGEPLQPLAQEDLAEAIARVVAGVAEDQELLELAGPEVTSLGDLLDRLERITGRSPMRFPVPESILSAAMQLAQSFGFEAGAADNPLVSLGEADALPAGTSNALVDVLSVTPTGLDEGLRRLVDGMPEQPPEEGVGPITRRRWWVDITNGSMDPDELFAWFRGHFAECLSAAGVESLAGDADTVTLDPGNTITFEIPIRGQVQVRVVEVEDRRATITTVQGHPVAATVMFGAREFGTAVRFEVSSIERAATAIDQLALAAGGSAIRDLTMESLLECVVRASGGEALEGVRSEEGDW